MTILQKVMTQQSSVETCKNGNKSAHLEGDPYAPWMRRQFIKVAQQNDKFWSLEAIWLDSGCYFLVSVLIKSE